MQKQTEDRLDPLILDLVEWIAKEPRPYADVIDTWRTSCPRLTVWEDAVDRGYVSCDRVEGRGVIVTATAQGQSFLQRYGRALVPTS